MMILLISGGPYWGGALIREAVLVLKILLFGGVLLLENGHSLDHLQQCKPIKVFITSFKSLTKQKLTLFNV